MTSHRVLSRWTGFCASCPVEQPLLLVSSGPHGFRAWLAGSGPEDRTLSYACGVCGRVEHVPATEAEDELYDLNLLRWPDWVDETLEVVAPVLLEAVSLPVVAPVAEPVVQVRRVTLPLQRVSSTDLVAA